MRKILIFGAMLCMFAACSKTEVKEPKSLQFSAAEKQMVNECNAFSFNLLTQVATTEEQENVVLSPLSASMLLGMLMNGADGETLAQIQAVTGFGAEATIEDINAYYKQLIEVLPNLDAYTNVGIANGIWVKDEFPVYEAFMQACKQNFDAQAKNVPTFVDDKVLKDINDFAAQHTNNRINQIINRGMVSEQTMMVLLNALYFKALWKDKFDKNYTLQQTFTTLKDAKIQVDMMRLYDKPQLYSETEDCRLVELPYKGDQYVADIILPAKDTDIRTWVKTLNAERWQQLISGLHSEEVNLGLPKFKLNYERVLTNDLSMLGMPSAFTPAANFSRLSELPTFISLIKQKTFIQVDEEGTEAAAVTIGDVAASAGPGNVKEFIADRPFLFVIRERTYGTILFTALIGHPAWQND